MSVRPSVLLASAVAVVSIVACTRAPYLIVFNRTGVPLTIMLAIQDQANGCAPIPGRAR